MAILQCPCCGSTDIKSDKKKTTFAGREFNWFECKSCGEPFIICPECRNTVDLDHMIKYGELPLKSGYEVVQGSMCAYCHNIFYFPFYK